MKVVASTTWNTSSPNSLGKLHAVGCDTNETPYAAIGHNLYEFKDNEFILVRPLSVEEDGDGEFEVFSINFDKDHQLYVSSNWNGLQVFKSANVQDENDLVFHETNWQGPANLSHPSGQLVGVNYKEEEGGVMNFINRNKETNELTFKPWPAWGSGDMGNWLMEGRDPAYSIRRAWYPDRMMIYITDSVTTTIPEDGIRSLHMFFAPDGRNIDYLSHTFLSLPWDNPMGCSIEIPHDGISSELLLFSPKGVYTERKKCLLNFEDLDDCQESFTKVFSATNIEGSGNQRSTYVIGMISEEKFVFKVLKVERK